MPEQPVTLAGTLGDADSLHALCAENNVSMETTPLNILCRVDLDQ